MQQAQRQCPGVATTGHPETQETQHSYEHRAVPKAQPPDAALACNAAALCNGGGDLRGVPVVRQAGATHRHALHGASSTMKWTQKKGAIRTCAIMGLSSILPLTYTATPSLSKKEEEEEEEEEEEDIPCGGRP